MNWLFPLMAVLGGVAISVQASVNGGLGKKIGTLEGAFVSFGIGTLLLLLLVIFFGQGSMLQLGNVPKWQLTGGLLGAFYVAIMVLVVPQAGVTTTVASVIVGQLLMSVIIDHYGLFGGKQIPMDGKKLIALLLMGVALYLFYKRS
ncbi:DMT family transporter [Brevibacillus dissolubilis]|uniref:DMT family transporter n=1 Tax=Brevibacillus dissolubilis TaxID=1844116 RepID=UPI00111621C0|nr:DMT family transporter [Brevibacillus dissolubilis]